MGKKNKKLKKKKMSLSAPASSQAMATADIADDSPAASTLASAPKTTPALSLATEQDDAEFRHVKPDVKRILALLGIIVLVLIGLYFLDAKTTYLASTADWLYKLLHIQAQ